MKKPKLKWMKSGRSFVAYAGGLHLTVTKTPMRLIGARLWRVRDVFGNHVGGDDFVFMESAAVAAETYARKALRAAQKALGR